MIFLLFSFSVSQNWIGLDFGSFYMKACNFTPSRNPQMLINHQSKRLTPTLLAFRTDKKDLLQSENYNTEESLAQFRHFIGIDAQSILSNHPSAGSGYFPAFIDSNDKWSAKLSQKLYIQNPKEKFGFFNMTSAFLYFYLLNVVGNSHENMSIAVTFPTSFTIPQKLELYHALKVIKVSDIDLVPDSLAVAYYFAIEGRHLGKTVLIIDVGATSVKAYAIRVEKTTHGLENKHYVDLYSYVINHEIGGAYITSILVDYMMNEYQKKYGHKENPIKFTDAEKRRFFDSAEKVKCQLSQLREIQVTVDNIQGNSFLFSMKVTKFEELITDMLYNITDVVQQAAGNLKIDAIEIIGGSSRIPKVQQMIMRSLYVQTIGHTLNADEVLAIGALYSFKTKLFVYDHTHQCKGLYCYTYPDETLEVCTEKNSIANIKLSTHPGVLHYKYHRKNFDSNRLQTRSWNITWSDKKEVPYTIPFHSLRDYHQVFEENNPENTYPIKYLWPKDHNHKFIRILSHHYQKQSEAEQKINQIEEIFLALSENYELKPSLHEMFIEQEIDQINLLFLRVKNQIFDSYANPTSSEIDSIYNDLMKYYKRYKIIETTKSQISRMKSLIQEVEELYKRAKMNYHKNIIHEHLISIKVALHDQEQLLEKEIKNHDPNINVEESEQTISKLIDSYRKLVSNFNKDLKAIHEENAKFLPLYGAIVKKIRKWDWLCKILDFDYLLPENIRRRRV
ncbi:hypothetical protein TRFO_40966 [Tritrichomonas foetus]|uniref:DnaK protein n=1 Tax=Tritrichomonas foetus TaxID=1144522 RepID=A0A1J4J5G4_9EUKA|nr:hypothetical protein TRFO_40966 [Tritrichomonas foetus]|eukprot:OHS92709.1 hypothetical protein TRFO_40966 [Tritrichomonas foetus]